MLCPFTGWAVFWPLRSMNPWSLNAFRRESRRHQSRALRTTLAVSPCLLPDWFPGRASCCFCRIHKLIGNQKCPDKKCRFMSVFWGLSENVL